MTPTRLNNIDVDGTLGWNTNQVANDAALLNVTRDLMISSYSGGSSIHNRGSIIESVNLTTRVVTFDVTPDPELESALSMATTSLTSSLPSGTALGASLPTMSAMIKAHPIYTLWWVNVPLKEKDKVPVLAIPTTVNGSSTVDLGSLGRHSAWTLVYNLTRPNSYASISEIAAIRPIPVAFDLNIVLSFNYDKTSGVLLGAVAEIHANVVAPRPCTTPGTVCPLTGSAVLFNRFSYNLQASLKLTSTNLNLDAPPPAGTSPLTNGNSNPGSSPTGSGSNPSTGTQPTTTTGSSQGANPGTTPASSNTPSGSKPPAGGTLLSELTPWSYWILGIVALAVVGIVGALRLYKRTN
jgi:hypothetical protein